MTEPARLDEGETLREESVTSLVHAVGAAATSRLPLEVTLAVLAEEKDDRRLADIASRLATELQRGVPLDQAIAQLDRHLPGEVGGLMRAAVETGDFAGTFEGFTQQRIISQRVARRIRTAMAYPLMIFAILVPLLLFLTVYVIPMFAELFDDLEKDFSMPLPAVTEVIFQIAAQVPIFLGGLALFIIVMPIVLRVVGGRWLFHRVRASVPLLGKLWMWSGQREFAAILASFLELRLPITSAVEHTSEMIGDRNVARACRRLVTRLEAGESLSASLNHSMHFDRSMAALAGWGEANGILPDALWIAADVMDDRTEQHAALVRRLLPPITLVAVTTLMFFVVVGLMVPLLQLLEALSW